MNDILIKKWSDLQDKLRKLDIVMGVDWDTTSDGEYVTNVYIYQDVKLKPLHYRTFDLQDMIEELEVYYLRAENKNKDQQFWDGMTKTWRTIVDAFVLLHLTAYTIGFIVVMVWLNGAGLLPEIIDAVLERFTQ